MTPACAIIEKFGGTRRAAAALGRPPSTVQSWKEAGLIPAKHQSIVLQAARASGVDIRPEDFFMSSDAAA